MDLSSYIQLRSDADRIFERVKEQYSNQIRCKLGCDDCCFAVFELTLVEAVNISQAFRQSLPRKERRNVLRSAEKAENEIRRIIDEAYSRTRSQSQILLEIGRARVECPLHKGNTCLLHEHRPVTCRLYGIPTVVRGKGVTCGRSGFEPGTSYPTANLDMFQQKMLHLSRTLFSNTRLSALSQTGFSMSRALMTEFDDARSA